MTFGLLPASALSGATYTLAPGPAFLALPWIGAIRDRRAGTLAHPNAYPPIAPCAST
jgi:hypothetical protein